MFLLVPPTALVYIEDTYNFQDFLSLLKLIYTAFKRVSKVKLDGVGPVDNRPSTDKQCDLGSSLVLNSSLVCEYKTWNHTQYSRLESEGCLYRINTSTTRCG